MNVFQMPFYENCESLQEICLCNENRRKTIHDKVRDDIGSALDFLHKKRLAFVDLHPGNILLITVGEKISAKLCDFESIRQFDQEFKKDQNCEHCKAKPGEGICWFHSKPPTRKPFVKNANCYNAKTDKKSLEFVLDWITKNKPCN